MTRDYGKNRSIDYAAFANLGGKKDITDDDKAHLIKICDNDYGNTPEEKLEYALAQSESMYRVCCLMAYGTELPKPKSARSRTHACMLASATDIGPFARYEGKTTDYVEYATYEGMEGMEGHTAYFTEHRYKIMLPYMQTTKSPSKLLVPKHYYYSGLDIATGPIEVGSIRRRSTMDKQNQIYTLYTHEADDQPTPANRTAFKLLAQVIVNANIMEMYIGVFDGRPFFEPRSEIERYWQTLAELTEKQVPGICPVCGKVIDRRRSENGGQPSHTCPKHQERFRQLKKKVRASQDYDPEEMAYADLCEQAVRGLRWKEPALNERILRNGTFKTQKETTSK